MNLVTILVVGCGNRGEVYSSYALKHPDRAKVVAIAEPRAHVRNKIKHVHNLTDDKYIFTDWHQIIELNELIANCAIIALPDKLHKEATIAFLKKGYNVLLEKPMAAHLDDCFDITSTSRLYPSQINAVCHVLRYLGPCIKIKKLIDSGTIGNVVNINHIEPVGFYHFAHSFVRGNWNNQSRSSFSLLAKCCHDIDLIIYWMQGKKCTQVQSFGSLNHFKKSNAPKNSGELCMKCPVESECCYSAKKIYLTKDPSRWPAKVVLNSEVQNIIKKESDIEDLYLKKSSEDKIKLLEECLSHEKTEYGRCVYKMPDNDVCDNQIVNMQFDDGSTASMTMIAFTKEICTRKTKIYGTKGMLEWDDAILCNKVVHTDFLKNKTEIIDCENNFYFDAKDSNENIKLDGHGGSDYLLMNSFIEACIKNDKKLVLTDFEDSFKSHLIVFASEYSRIHNQVIDINEFCRIKQIQ